MAARAPRRERQQQEQDWVSALAQGPADSTTLSRGTPAPTSPAQRARRGVSRRSLQQLAQVSKQAPTRSVSDVRTYIVRGLRLAPRLFSVLLLPRRYCRNRLRRARRPAVDRVGLRRNAPMPPPSLTQLSTTFARRLRSGNSQSLGIGPKTSCKKKTAHIQGFYYSTEKALVKQIIYHQNAVKAGRFYRLHTYHTYNPIVTSINQNRQKSNRKRK